MYLDITQNNTKQIKTKFPNLFRECASFGIDISQMKIPIAPAAHYSCGGVYTDNFVDTCYDNLYALGEAAYSSMHGAGIVCGNALLECISVGQMVAKDIKTKIQSICTEHVAKQSHHSGHRTDINFEYLSNCYFEIKNIMSNHVGIMRSDEGLSQAKLLLEDMKVTVNDIRENFILHCDIEEIRSMLDVAILVTDSALMRKESRGVHYNVDYPNKDIQYEKPTIIQYPIKKLACTQL